MAVKVLFVITWTALMVLTVTGVLPFALIAVWFITLIPLALLFSRWEAADLARRPIVRLAGSAPQPGDVVHYASWFSRLLAALVAAVIGVPVAVFLFWIPYAWLIGIPVAIGLGWFLWRSVRISLELTWDEVVVNNPLRTHRLRWSNVTHVFLGSEGGIVLLPREQAHGIEAIATRGWRVSPELVHDLRRYGEPHGVEFGEDLLRL